LPALSAVDHDPFADAPLARVAPTTEAQREVWLAAQFSPQASLAYNESVSLRLRGRLDVAALDAALQDLVARHEALRAVAGADGQTLQILEALQVAVPIQDLRGSTTGERELALTAVLRRAVTTPFDLTVGPFVRAELLAIADDDHLLVLTAHHIVCDGWSFGVIVEDLATLYAGRLRRTAPKLPAAASFVDYSIAQHVRTSTAEHAADEAFWLSQFAGEPPVLDLPTDRPRGNSRSFDSRRVDHALDGALVAALRQLAARSGVSLFSAMLAGFVALLHRLAAPTDLVIGVPSAGQSVDDRPWATSCMGPR